MAKSNFKIKNLNVITTLTKDLIGQISHLQPGDENFVRAEEFMLEQFENNPFQDTDEHKIRRELNYLNEKFRAHNQDEKAGRIAYLNSQFRKMPMKQTGISNTHDSVFHLLLLL